MTETIGVVTCIGGDYTRFLDDWVQAVEYQTRPPDQIAIVDNGADDPEAVEAAADRLGATLVRLPWTHNWGRARNIAVDAVPTDWAAHVDVDDVLMDHALEDWEQLAPDADVVGFGWKRLGGSTKVRTYAAHQGDETLHTAGPAGAVSPFRRGLWARSPYRDDLAGGWDTGLWRGFGHLGARFVPTRRPVYWYRYHPDSIFQTRQRDTAAAVEVGDRLGQLAKDPPPDVTVVVPWRDTGDLDRRAAWAWLKRRWEALHPDWPIVEAAPPDGVWNKAAAVNRAVEPLDCRVVVIADADCIVADRQIVQAVFQAQTCPWVVPHGDVHRLNFKSTARLLRTRPDIELPEPGGTIRQPYRGFPGGGMIVIGRAQYDRMGGFDETFQGWGVEDEAFALAADTMLGPHARLEGPLSHLYHDPGPRAKDPNYRANRDRWETYRDLSGDREAMADLVDVDL